MFASRPRAASSSPACPGPPLPFFAQSAIVYVPNRASACDMYHHKRLKCSPSDMYAVVRENLPGTCHRSSTHRGCRRPWLMSCCGACFYILAMLIALSFLDSFNPMLVQPLQAAPWPAAARAAAGLHPQTLSSVSLAFKASDVRSEQRLPPWAAAGRAAAAAAAAQWRHARRGFRAVAAASSQQGSIEDTIAMVLELQLDVLPGSPQFEANVRYLSRLAGK